MISIDFCNVSLRKHLIIYRKSQRDSAKVLIKWKSPSVQFYKKKSTKQTKTMAPTVLQFMDRKIFRKFILFVSPENLSLDAWSDVVRNNLRTHQHFCAVNVKMLHPRLRCPTSGLTNRYSNMRCCWKTRQIISSRSV